LSFHSILFGINEDRPLEEEAPAFFHDLNLDQIIEAITQDKQEYNLKPFYYTSVDHDIIVYRQEIMKDLENPVVYDSVQSFAEGLRLMDKHLNQAEKLYYQLQKKAWFLDAIAIYCEAVNHLADCLIQIELQSRGFLAFREFVTHYCGSEEFRSLRSDTSKLKWDLNSIKYCLLIDGNKSRIRQNAVCIEVRPYKGEVDYSSMVEATFEKFKQGAVKNYQMQYTDQPNMNQVENGILELVAQLNPDIFINLDNYYKNRQNYMDETISAFNREIQYYIAYLDFIVQFKEAGLKFCYPKIIDQTKEIYNSDGFDLALANKLIQSDAMVVCNDFYLRDKERILVVSGPNQGGKTTFARTFGQIHYLASIGLTVPGREAQLFMFDRLFTHFEKEESISNPGGKLHDDLLRVKDILRQSTSDSIIIMNEIFTSTTLNDAVFLSKKILAEIIELDILCVWVTFIDELSSLSEKTVSMVSMVYPENPSIRTFKIARRTADGLSYAISIAEKYGLTYQRLKERLKT